MITRTFVLAHLGELIAAVCLVAFPFVASDFWIGQIATKSLWLAIIAMSLIFLAGYGGMISLAQMAIAGIAGYTVGILTVTQGFDAWTAAAIGMLLAVGIGLVLGAVAARTYGIYFLMITLAYGVAVYFLANQAHELTGGLDGINGVVAPTLGELNVGARLPLYVVCAAAAALCYVLLRYVVTSTPFGLVLQGIRDNPERMEALGYRVSLHRALAFGLAASIASVGGVLSVWYNVRVSPGSIDVTRTIDILIIAVVGGMNRLSGAFAGAILLTVLSNYMSDFTARYNLVIGVIFVVIVLASPNGVMGLTQQAKHVRGRIVARFSRTA